MPKKPTRRRVPDKDRHLDVVATGACELSSPPSRVQLVFSDLRFRPSSLPEVDFSTVDLSTSFLGKTIAAPFMISPMTGGTPRARVLNRRLACAAEHFSIPFSVGSQRVALERPALVSHFRVRDLAPTIPLFANLGAIQLVHGFGPDDARRAVDMIEADALFLHLDAVQEVIQEGGNTNWSGVLPAIERVCNHLAKRGPTPVFVREVGFGIAEDTAKKLLDAGVTGIDCAGAGGTSWSLVEGKLARSSLRRRLGETFADWGLRTPESILEIRRASATIPLIASGGVRTGLDVAKCLALGADLAGIASPLLRAAMKGDDALSEAIEALVGEFRLALFAVGASTVTAFRRNPRLFFPRAAVEHFG